MPEKIVIIKFLLYIAAWIIGISLVIKYCWKDDVIDSISSEGVDDLSDVRDSLDMYQLEDRIL